jgi:hypothetical protein
MPINDACWRIIVAKNVQTTLGVIPNLNVALLPKRHSMGPIVKSVNAFLKLFGWPVADVAHQNVGRFCYFVCSDGEDSARKRKREREKEREKESETGFSDRGVTEIFADLEEEEGLFTSGKF